MKRKQKILIIVGPTSSGKSALAVVLARKFGGEVISSDSRQVYKGLDIGTGKITKREMRGIPHHMLDVVAPKKTFSAHDYRIHTHRAIAEVVCRGKLPIIVGGTGLYMDALVGRVALPSVPPNPELRAKLKKKSAAQLFAILKKRDARRAKTMDSPSERNNKVRLMRALEIVHALGSVPHLNSRNPEYDVLWVGIKPTVKKLEKRISARLRARIKQGMIAEAKRLHRAGLSYKRMEELGIEYRSLASLLQGRITREQMIEELRRTIRRYAKRQIAYWKRNKNIVWFKKPEVRKVSEGVTAWLKK